jgi:hypothetical protein
MEEDKEYDEICGNCDKYDSAFTCPNYHTAEFEDESCELFEEE